MVADKPAVGVQEYVYVDGLVKVIDQLFNVPEMIEASSATQSVQLPLTLVPFNNEKACSGIYVPVYGAVPAVIAVVADVEKQVLV